MKAQVWAVLHSLHNDESGQDLIEYALVAALIAFGAVATMGALATRYQRSIFLDLPRSSAAAIA